VSEIAAAKFADLIAVAGDPLRDVTSLQHTRFVMKGATVVTNEMVEKVALQRQNKMPTQMLAPERVKRAPKRAISRPASFVSAEVP